MEIAPKVVNCEASWSVLEEAEEDRELAVDQAFDMLH